jgi:hypothetical protein
MDEENESMNLSDNLSHSKHPLEKSRPLWLIILIAVPLFVFFLSLILYFLFPDTCKENHFFCIPPYLIPILVMIFVGIPLGIALIFIKIFISGKNDKSYRSGNSSEEKNVVDKNYRINIQFKRAIVLFSSLIVLNLIIPSIEMNYSFGHIIRTLSMFVIFVTSNFLFCVVLYFAALFFVIKNVKYFKENKILYIFCVVLIFISLVTTIKLMFS